MATQQTPEQPQQAGGLYTSPKRLYLTLDGTVVENGDPAAHSLLVPAGGTLLWAKAQRYGLVPAAAGAAPPPVEPPAPVDADGKAQAAPPQTKQQTAPGGTK